MADPESIEERLAALERAMARHNPGLTTPEAVTLREYFESRLVALEKASQVAASALSERLAGMNEFRETLRDQAVKFVTREEVSLQIEKLGSEINTLREFKAALEGKASMSTVVFSALLGAAGIVIGIIGLLR